MNILGINGAIGWDANIGMIWGNDYWVHGSGATLFIDGELKGSLSEERLTRLKYDGNYPENSIQQLLLKHHLNYDDIDIVGYVTNACFMAWALKLQGYTNKVLSENFPNAKIIFVDHHLAHAAGSFISSGFEESNIFSMDGAGDFHPTFDSQSLNNSGFYNGTIKQKSIESLQHTFLEEKFNMFGGMYTEFSSWIYQLKTEGKVDGKKSRQEFMGPNMSDDDMEKRARKLQATQRIASFDEEVDMTDYKGEAGQEKSHMGPKERETYPGKIMGLSAYGDYTKVDIPNIFSMQKMSMNNPRAFSYTRKHKMYDMPIMLYNEDVRDNVFENINDYSPEDLASWLQHQFEEMLLEYLKNIPKEIKTKKICLAGGCALNISANSKIIEEGIYEDVHVNTAPNDDGLNFGAASLCTLKNEEEVIIPENIGCIGLDYSEEDIRHSLFKFGIEDEGKNAI